jgi:hypothetical protein
MLEFLIQMMLLYSMLKLLFHLIIEGHHPRDIWDAMNKAGSSLQYKVRRNEKR